MRLETTNIESEILASFSGRLFLSRQGQKRRKIINFDEIEILLKEFDYQIISPESVGLSFVKQLIGKSTHLVAPNGAALCNSIFSMSDDLKVGIIYPQSHIDDYYFRVTTSFGREFFGILNIDDLSTKNLSQLIEEYYYPSVGEDYYVDTDRLRTLLISMN